MSDTCWVSMATSLSVRCEMKAQLRHRRHSVVYLLLHMGEPSSIPHPSDDGMLRHDAMQRCLAGTKWIGQHGH